MASQNATPPLPTSGKEEFFETIRYFKHHIDRLDKNLDLKLGIEVRLSCQLGRPPTGSHPSLKVLR